MPHSGSLHFWPLSTNNCIIQMYQKVVDIDPTVFTELKYQQYWLTYTLKCVVTDSTIIYIRYVYQTSPLLPAWKQQQQQ